MLEQTEEMLSSLAALYLGAVRAMPQQLAQIASDVARVETELDTISLVGRISRVSSVSHQLHVGQNWLSAESQRPFEMA